MEKINSLEDLRAAILKLEREHEEDGKKLKEQLLLTIENFKPINLIKNTLKEAVASKELKDTIITTGISLVVGFLSKLIIDKLTNTPVKKIISNTLLTGIAALVEKNSDTFKSIGNELLKLFKKKTGEDKHEDIPEGAE